MNTTKRKDVFGCDIGNGFGYISVLNDVDRDPLPMFPSKYKLDAVGMPTSAYIAPPDGNEIEVFEGRSACDKHKKESDKFIHAVKTRLNQGFIPVPGISNVIPVDKIYAAIARDLIRLGNEERRNRGKEPIYEIVFTFPASFTKDLDLLNRMQKSIENVQINGQNIKVVGRLPEPAAVAIDYLYYMQNIAPADIKLSGDSYTALVYDLGHGTFDVAVVTARSKGEPYQLHINDGLPDVGGKDFDAILYDEICGKLKIEYDYTPTNSNAREIIRNAAIEIKHELSDSDESSREISLPDGTVANVEITRTMFEEKGRRLIYRTFELVNNVMRQAKKDKIKIDSVILSGGASQMPMVVDGLKRLLGDEGITIQVYRPSKAVSYGAARYAYGRADEVPVPKPESKQATKYDAITKNLEKSAPKSESVSTPTSRPMPPKPEQPTPSILENYSEYCYGIWVPSDENLAGIVNVMVESKRKLPAISDEITLVSSGSPMRIRLYRSKVKNVKQKTLNVEEQSESIMFIPFDVPENTECIVRIEVLEDYNVRIMCKPMHAQLIEKSTMDRFLETEALKDE